MKSRVFVFFCLLATVFLPAVSFVEAQEAGKIYRIGYLSVRGPEREKGRLLAFQQGLRDLGYFEGKNIV